ncbi:MAG: serine protease [Candidatus Omnitrophica bacterium]|nr:serine protease [Candidatus Omnitrophota bacterium]MDD5553690.1 serine protease [Candidatus Omnitrophota bacterium]
MKKKPAKHKIKRYLAVYKRGARRLTLKRALAWTKINLRSHPFVLGILFFLWLNNALDIKNYSKGNIIPLIRFHIYILAAWLILTVVSNLLNDKYKVKWYLRKRVVFSLLILVTPVGLILLWSGTKFKKKTKIALTFIFVTLFIATQIYYTKKYEKILAQNPVERIIETISKPKKKTFVKGLDKDLLAGLQLPSLPEAQRVKLAVSDIASRSSQATVSIKVSDKKGEEMGKGSGFLVSNDGVIVTNFHVLESAYKAEVKIGEGEYKEAFFVKGDPGLDMALLKVEGEDFPYLPVGDSDNVINGQFIVVMGDPWGFERSVSSGIISGVRSKGDIKVLQMTAPVSPGSSGGPVINEYGEVIGVTTVASFFMAQNLNFAVAINNLKKLIAE